MIKIRLQDAHAMAKAIQDAAESLNNLLLNAARQGFEIDAKLIEKPYGTLTHDCSIWEVKVVVYVNPNQIF